MEGPLDGRVGGCLEGPLDGRVEGRAQRRLPRKNQQTRAGTKNKYARPMAGMQEQMQAQTNNHKQ